MEAENMQLQLQLVEEKASKLVDKMHLLTDLIALQDSLLDFRCPPEHKHTMAVNQQYRDKYKRTCPTRLTRGKNKGQPCGKICMLSHDNSLSYLGQSIWNPCCEKHVWEIHPDYPEYTKAYEAASAKDEALNEERRNVETSKIRVLIAEYKKSALNLLDQIDTLTAKYPTAAEIQKLQKVRTALTDMYDKLFDPTAQINTIVQNQ